jgi:DNA primase catalytic core
MQRIKNIEEVILQLKPLLRRYLEENGTQFRGSLFSCPNKKEHLDVNPSCGFLPDSDQQFFHCFSCGKSGDTFTAYSLLENKDINGSGWFETVKELADRYGIKYQLEPLKLEEVEFNNVQTFLQNIVKNAHTYLVKNHPIEVTKYIQQRKWENLIEHFTLGYLPNQQNVRKFIADSFIKYPELAKYLAIDISNSDIFTDKIVNRLIYPIRHRYGYILGIVNRAVLDSDIRSKYIKYFLKTAEKTGVIFNLTKTYKTVYVVEGASSVFTLYNNGIKNVVSSLGTAFTEEMYNSLIKHGIDRIILCFDGDEAGRNATYKALELTQNKSDIKVLVKLLPDNKDPDEVVNELGIDFFKNISEVSNFKFQLNRYKITIEEEQEKLKKSLFEIVISSKDAIIREKMLKLFTQETGVSKTILVEEIEKHEKTQGLITEVGVGEVLKEETSLIKSIEAFEERALRSGRLKGISTGFPIFDNAVDGVSTGLILVAGKWNCGKSAFIQSMGINMLEDPTNHILYFSIDDPAIYTTIPRFVANLSTIAINTISNPIYRIDRNETLEEVEKLVLKNKRNEAIEKLKGYASRLGIKDSTDGYDINYIEKIIKVYKIIAKDKKLILFVDFLNMVTLGKKNIERTEQEVLLAGFFKHMAGLYDIPVICTVEGTKGVTDSTMKESGIKGSSSLQYRSDLTLLLSSDFEVANSSELYFYDDKGEANPVVRVQVSKNKMSGFRKSIYFKFYRNFNKFIECTAQEQQEYGRKG